METIMKPTLKDRVAGAVNTAKTYWNTPLSAKPDKINHIKCIKGDGFM